MKIYSLILLIIGTFILNQEEESSTEAGDESQMAEGLQFFYDMLDKYVVDGKLNVIEAIDGVEVIEADDKNDVKG